MLKDCSALRAWLGELKDKDGTLAARVAEDANRFFAAHKELTVVSLEESGLSLAQEHLQRSPALPKSGFGKF